MTPPDADTQHKRVSFRQLHAQGCFVLPNPWDVGSARYLQRQGFLALATTSAGCVERRATGRCGLAAGHLGAPEADGGGDSTSIECRFR